MTCNRGAENIQRSICNRRVIALHKLCRPRIIMNMVPTTTVLPQHCRLSLLSFPMFCCRGTGTPTFHKQTQMAERQYSALISLLSSFQLYDAVESFIIKSFGANNGPSKSKLMLYVGLLSNGRFLDFESIGCSHILLLFPCYNNALICFSDPTNTKKNSL